MTDVERIFYIFIGIVLLLLGIVGLLLPVIPGIPFFIMGIMFFAKGSVKFMKWMLNNKHLGPFIRKFRKRGLSKKIRNFTLITVWITHVFSFFYIKILAVKIFLVLMLSVVTWILLVIKTYDSGKKK